MLNTSGKLLYQIQQNRNFHWLYNFQVENNISVLQAFSGDLNEQKWSWRQQNK